MLPSVPTFLDGLYLAVNAVPDSCIVVDGPDGCYMKQEHIHVNHDLFSTLIHPLGLHRVVQTGANPQGLAFGTEENVRGALRAVATKMKPSFIVVTETSMCLMASSDLKGLAGAMERELGLPIQYIKPLLFEGDYLDGFAAFLDTLVDVLLSTDSLPKLKPNTVALVGFFPERMEEDTRADLEELKEIIRALRLQLCGVLLGGGALGELRKVLSASVLLALPHGQTAAQKIASVTGAKVVPVCMPLGFRATADFAETVAQVFGRQEEMKKYVKKNMRQWLPALEKARYYFLRDRLVAVAAEPVLAKAFAGFLEEIGVEVGVVALRTRHQTWLKRLGRSLAENVFCDFTPGDLFYALSNPPLGRSYDVVIGSSNEREIAWTAGCGFVEIGYPSFISHALYPKPMLGFKGAMRLLDELVHAVLRNDFERRLRGLPTD